MSEQTEAEVKARRQRELQTDDTAAELPVVEPVCDRSCELAMLRLLWADVGRMMRFWRDHDRTKESRDFRALQALRKKVTMRLATIERVRFEALNQDSAS
ncbi:MAG: hypothetical protein KDB01_26170 [Planctomycetaceae bacterium]|nr:hypothetical protein [Planctomycetaceae bacterium]